MRGDEKRRLGVSHGNPLMNILKEVPPPLPTLPPSYTRARTRSRTVKGVCKTEDVDISLLAFIHPAGNGSTRVEKGGGGRGRSASTGLVAA